MQMRWIDYRDALGVGFSDYSKIEMLASKIVTLFQEDFDVGLQVEEKICKKFFIEIGERNYHDAYYFSFVGDRIADQNTIEGIICYTVAFANATRKADKDQVGEYVFDNLKTFLYELNLDYELINDADGSFIFPKGAKELDEGNVNIPFEWLKSYSLSRNAMEKALRAYSNMEEASQVADLFRKALETFGQEFFHKSASLENLKTVFGQFFKEKGVPKELSSNFETILQMYTNYMNSYAKHHDKTERKYLEYIMYQTGNIIRFVISLSND